MSRFGVIPKSHQPGKWRLIVDLSYPEGKSVNDGIDPNLMSLNYASKGRRYHLAVGAVGSRCFDGQTGFKSAYRNVPVHPQDRFLLQMQWEGKVHIDATLLFRLRSAPKIFNTVANTIEWIVKQHGVEILWHYLDDFIICGPAGSEECFINLQMLIDIYNHLGVPLAKEKLEGPTTALVFLGVLINIIRGEL